MRPPSGLGDCCVAAAISGLRTPLPSSNKGPTLSTRQEYRMNDIERVGLLSKIHLPGSATGKGSQLRPSYTTRCLSKLAFSPTTSRMYRHKFAGFTRWKNKKNGEKNVIKKLYSRVRCCLSAKRISLSSPWSALVFL